MRRRKAGLAQLPALPCADSVVHENGHDCCPHSWPVAARHPFAEAPTIACADSQLICAGVVAMLSSSLPSRIRALTEYA